MQRWLLIGVFVVLCFGLVGCSKGEEDKQPKLSDADKQPVYHGTVDPNLKREKGSIGGGQTSPTDPAALTREKAKAKSVKPPE